MSWHASLSVDHSALAGKTMALYEHNGPLRILQSLYSEGEGTCHNVIVHPPCSAPSYSWPPMPGWSGCPWKQLSTPAAWLKTG